MMAKLFGKLFVALLVCACAVPLPSIDEDTTCVTPEAQQLDWQPKHLKFPKNPTVQQCSTMFNIIQWKNSVGKTHMETHTQNMCYRKTGHIDGSPPGKNC